MNQRAKMSYSSTTSESTTSPTTPSKTLSSWQCVDPGCKQFNAVTAKICTRCKVNPDFFRKPKENDLQEIKSRLEQCYQDIKTAEEQVEGLKKTKSTFVQDVEAIISLRLKLQELKPVSKEAAEKTSSKPNEDRRRQALKILKMTQILLRDPGIDDKIETNVRRAYDFYITCQDMMQTTTDPTLTSVLRQAFQGAASALYLKLVDYIESFPWKKYSDLKETISESSFLDLNSSKNINDDKDLKEDDIGKVIALLQGSMIISDDSVTQLVKKEDSFEALRTLNGALICLESLLDPTNDLKGFKKGIPNLDEICLKTRQTLEQEVQSFGASLAAAANPRIQESPEENQIIEELLGRIWNYVDQQLKHFHVNYDLAKKVKVLSQLENPALPEMNKSSASSRASGLSVRRGGAINRQNSRPQESDQDDDDQKSEKEYDQLSDVIYSGDDDIVV